MNCANAGGSKIVREIEDTDYDSSRADRERAGSAEARLGDEVSLEATYGSEWLAIPPRRLPRNLRLQV